MAEAKNDMGAIYDALRCELIHLLMEHRSQGRFTGVTEGTDQARSLFLVDLTRSIADILAAAYPKKASNAYAAVLADAETIASSIVASSRPTKIPTNLAGDIDINSVHSRQRQVASSGGHGHDDDNALN
jgi:hypothetical protein